MIHRPMRIFISSSEKDARHLDEFVKHLAVLERQRLIAHWHQHRIGAGGDVAAQIDAHLEAADIIVIAVSPDFLASDYFHDVELARSLARHAEGSTRIPLLIRPADWQSTDLRRLQPLPKDKVPITKWSDRDDAWMNVIDGIREVVEELRRDKTLAAENETLREEVERLAGRELDLTGRCAQMALELEDLRGKHRQFDAEVERSTAMATAALRGEARTAQALIADLTSQLGGAHTDLQVQRGLVERLSSQRQEHQSVIHRLKDELRETKVTADTFAWRLNSGAELLSGGASVHSTDKLTVVWRFCVKNCGQTVIRLKRADVVWCLITESPQGSSRDDLHEHPDTRTFEENPVLTPGQRSEVYEITVDTRVLSAEHAKVLTGAIRARLLVVFGGVDEPYQSSTEKVLEREGEL